MKKAIYLKWIDASSKDGWIYKEEVKDFMNSEHQFIHTIGFLEMENKDYILLSQNYNEDEASSMHMKIPKKWIIKKRAIK